MWSATEAKGRSHTCCCLLILTVTTKQQQLRDPGPKWRCWGYGWATLKSEHNVSPTDEQEARPGRGRTGDLDRELAPGPADGKSRDAWERACFLEG